MERNDSPKAIGTRIKEARQAKGWTQAKLATISKVGSDGTGISRLESGAGENTPNDSTLQALSQALGINLEWMCHGTGPKDAPTPYPSPAPRERDTVRATVAALTGLLAFLQDRKLTLSPDRQGYVLGRLVHRQLQGEELTPAVVGEEIMRPEE